MTAAFYEEWWFWLFIGPELVAMAFFLIWVPFLLIHEMLKGDE